MPDITLTTEDIYILLDLLWKNLPSHFDPHDPHCSLFFDLFENWYTTVRSTKDDGPGKTGGQDNADSNPGQ